MTYSNELEELKAENLRLRKLIKCCGPNTRCKTGAAFMQKEAKVPADHIRVLVELGSRVKRLGILPPELNSPRVYSFVLRDTELEFDRKSFIQDKVGIFTKSTVSIKGIIV